MRRVLGAVLVFLVLISGLALYRDYRRFIYVPPPACAAAKFDGPAFAIAVEKHRAAAVAAVSAARDAKEDAARIELLEARAQLLSLQSTNWKQAALIHGIVDASCSRPIWPYEALLETASFPQPQQFYLSYLAGPPPEPPNPILEWVKALGPIGGTFISSAVAFGLYFLAGRRDRQKELRAEEAKRPKIQI